MRLGLAVTRSQRYLGVCSLAIACAAERRAQPVLERRAADSTHVEEGCSLGGRDRGSNRDRRYPGYLNSYRRSDTALRSLAAGLHHGRWWRNGLRRLRFIGSTASSR